MAYQAGMWYLIACMQGLQSTMCATPAQMPSLQVCQTVGAELRKTMIGGARRVICVNGDNGQSVDVKEAP